jgi:DNA-binding transcriptional LysR family regulator
VAPAFAAFARQHPALRVSYQAGAAHADLMPSYALPPQAVYAVYPDTRHVSAKVRRFIDFLRTGK